MFYYLDTEFIERFHKPLFGKARHVIELVSISLVSEDIGHGSRTYNAISSEYEYKYASKWVKGNVIAPLFSVTVHGDARNHTTLSHFHKHYGKPIKQIAKEIFEFVNPGLGFRYSELNNSEIKTSGNMDSHFNIHNVALIDNRYVARPTFKTYFGSYDWVLFCSLFGTMMELPSGFPMYTIDLKQELDKKVTTLNLFTSDTIMGDAIIGPDVLDGRPSTFDEKLKWIKSTKEYPEDNDNHLSLHDALWNQKLDKFIQSIKD